MKRPIIIVDWGGWLHIPSGDKLILKPGTSQAEWNRLLLVWLRKYPGVTVHDRRSGLYCPAGRGKWSTEQLIVRLEKKVPIGT